MRLVGGSFEPPFEAPEWYNRYDCIIFFVLTNRYGHPHELIKRKDEKKFKLGGLF